jgi:hypothetical protein
MRRRKNLHPPRFQGASIMVNLKLIRLLWPAFVPVLALTWLAPAPARADKELRWKFKPGETLHYRMIQEMSMNMRMGEGKPPMATTMNQTVDMSWKAESVDDQGVISMDQTIDRMQMKMQSAQGVLLDYDSSSGKQPEGMGKMLVPMLDAMLKKPFRIKFTPRGEIKDMKLPQGMLESMNKMAGGLFSEDTIKQFSEMAVFPEGPLTPGRTWSRKVAMKNPMFGNLVMETIYRYEGPETRDGKTLDKITMSIAFKTEEAKEQGEKKAEAKPMVEFKDQTGGGTLLFDAEAGRLLETSGKTKMKVDVSVMGQKISQDIETNTQMKLQPAGAGAAAEGK